MIWWELHNQGDAATFIVGELNDELPLDTGTSGLKTGKFQSEKSTITTNSRYMNSNVRHRCQVCIISTYVRICRLIHIVTNVHSTGETKNAESTVEVCRGEGHG
jgi:hypothetical protein